MVDATFSPTALSVVFRNMADRLRRKEPVEELPTILEMNAPF